MNKIKTRPRDDSATDSQDDSDLDCRTHNSKFGRNSVPVLKKIKIKGYDTTDALPSKLNFNLLDIFGIVLSICTYFMDVALDILLAVVHFRNGNTWYFTLTVCFIAVPSLTMTGFSLRWYLVDADEKQMPKVSTRKWIFRIVFLVFQMGPVLRYIDSLYYGLKSNKSKGQTEKQVDFYKQMIYEDADATLLRLFETFMECAPQLVLQIYIYAQSQAIHPNSHSVTELIQLLSMLSSLISMAWALASYQRALRYSLMEKKNMTICGTIVQIIWRFFDISSRVIALGLFASIFPNYLFIVCAAHYAVMFTWIRLMKTEFCDNHCGEFLYNIVLGIVFIFCYFNPKDSPTRRRFTFFYTLAFLENSALMSTWFIYCPPHILFRYPAMFMQFLSFVLGLVIMIIYYLLLHPTKNINVWDHWTKGKPSEIHMQNGDAVAANKEIAGSNVQEHRV